MIDISKHSDENVYDYIRRITYGKRDGVYDIDYCEWANLILGKSLTSDESRKRFYGVVGVIEQIESDIIDSLPKTQMQKARELLGEQLIVKKQIQSEKNEISKIQKGFIKSISIVEELNDILEKNNFVVNVPEYCHIELDESSEFVMIVHITDWHIGYVIEDCKGNYFNWNIANQRIDNLITECKKYAELYNIKKIYVVNTGDCIEGVSMRKNQSQFCEFNQAVQINKAIEIIFRFLIALCQFANVEYDSIYGNHDRTNGDLSANLDGDNADTIIREQISKYKELSNTVRLTVINRKHTDKEIVKNINGLKCKFIHGEYATKDDKTQLKNEMSMDNEFYDLFFKGHIHNFGITSENNGRYIISTGCISGFNDYSVRFGCSTVASQTIAVIGNSKVELIKDVQLELR